MLVVIRGAGDIATGIALRLFRSGIKIVMTDLPQPTSIRRTVCFSQAIVLGRTEVEGVAAVLAADAAEAEKQIASLTELGFGGIPVCMAKTQYSLTDDAKKLGRPRGFTMQVRDVTLSAGAGFAVVLTGNIMTMPGLPKSPAAERIDVDENGVITGMF